MILVCKKAQKGQLRHFIAVKKLRLDNVLVLWFIRQSLKDGAFTAIKRDTKI